ncbi:MAG: butyrate kinase [Fusobacteriaceae bacterium]
MKKYKILSINPGSTSTKISIYENEKKIIEKVIRHSIDEIEKFKNIYSQKDFREKIILKSLEESNIDLKKLSAVVGRGGLLKPITGGTYLVTEEMIEDLSKGVLGEHASNLGGIIAKKIADKIGKKAYIVDPVVVDELEKVARISGIPEIERKSIFHALNQKAVARKYCKENNLIYKNINLIVAHMGGGISTGIHKNGKVIDVNNALDGEGTFSPERSGTLPVGDLVEMCFSKKYSEEFIKKRIKGNGGIVSYLNTNDIRDIIKMIEAGDEKAKIIFEALIYQIAKDIGAMSTVVSGDVKQIILTGGIAYSNIFVEALKKKIEFISEVTVYPGEEEMTALTLGALRVERGEEKVKKYKK